MQRILLVLLALLSWECALSPAAARAQTPLPFDELGAGPRATAMGQAFTAVADDGSAAYYNPAGLPWIRSPIHLTLGYVYAKPRVKVRFAVPPQKNPYLEKSQFDQSEDFSSRGIYVAYTCNFADVSAMKDSVAINRLAFGLTLFSNLPEINQFDNPQRPQDPYVFKYNERWSLVAMALSFGFRCTDWLSVGAGVLPRVDGLQESTGSWISLQRALDPNDPAKGFRMDLRQTTRINLVPIGGILIRPEQPVLGCRVSLGCSYRGKMWGYYGTGPTAVDVLLERPGQDPFVIYQDPGGRSVDYIGFSPEQITAGISVAPLPELTAALDLTWKRYSSFHFFWDIPPFDVQDSRQVDLPFRDIWVPRVGLEYRLHPRWEAGKYARRVTEIALRGGYYREPSPVPDMSGPMNILDADQNVFSCGFGIRYDALWTDYVQFDASFQAHMLEKNTIPNDRDPLFGPITVSGAVYSAGVALSVVY